MPIPVAMGKFHSLDYNQSIGGLVRVGVRADEIQKYMGATFKKKYIPGNCENP